jgi:hypothetical protein
MQHNSARVQRAFVSGHGKTSRRAGAQSVALAIVHHANQYLITDGYLNRSGLDESADGYLKILRLHQAHDVPFNLHISGTLLECLAWYRPDVLSAVRDLLDAGLVELIGSSYGQNIMRFFSHECNRKQIDEHLSLYRDILDVNPRRVRVFWPPERVWDTLRMAPVLGDSTLSNGGYGYVLLDDRTMYPASDGDSSRQMFDRRKKMRVRDFIACRICDGNHLIALPIARNLRWSIPPSDETSFERMEELLDGFDAAPHAAGTAIAIYADDMEKTAGFGGWDVRGPIRFDAFLQWLTRNNAFRPLKLQDWTASQQVLEERPIDVGTFVELSAEFGAGDDYERWYYDPLWQKYRSYYEMSEAKVKQRSNAGADVGLIELAWKQLLASSWETAWHTPSSGVHGDPSNHGEPSPWIKAVASHSRHAMVISEAAYWMTHRDGSAHARVDDIDGDGEDELILENDKLFAVFAPRRGARLVYLFNLEGRAGKMVVGNPCDDWNWQEELNKYMEVPANHPGALADLGFEDHRYNVTLSTPDGGEVAVSLTSDERASADRVIQKVLSLSAGSNEIQVTYRGPKGGRSLIIECGLSPDYRSLLRCGRKPLLPICKPATWGFQNGDVSAWIRVEDAWRDKLDGAEERDFGHGRAIRFPAPGRAFTFYVGCHCRARSENS